MSNNDFVANDSGSKLKINCYYEETNTVIDLTGATVKIEWRPVGGEVVITKTMTITAATAGEATYQFSAGELEAGNMEFSVSITNASGEKITGLDFIKKLNRAEV